MAHMEAQSCFETEQRGNSAQNELCCRASRRPSTFKEGVREPVKYDGQCCSENAEAFVVH